MATRTALTSPRLRRHDLIGYSLTRIFRDGDGTTREHLVGLFTTPRSAIQTIRTRGEDLHGLMYSYLVLEGIPDGAFGTQVLTHSWWVYQYTHGCWKRHDTPPDILFHDDRRRGSKWVPIGIRYC